MKAFPASKPDLQRILCKSGRLGITGRRTEMLEKSEKLVAAFGSTHDALLCEQLCQEAGVQGRLIPIPTDITADCGLCFMMPPEEKERFQAVIAGKLSPAGYYLRMLWG